ncbi:MAG TPA: hypothetical protein VJN63_05185 [Thermoplasmata archaeon]|nr:hypothetical protein [Thermoplasmata archaeon]
MTPRFCGDCGAQAALHNLDTIPAKTTLAWDLDVLIDPFDEASFSYLFTLEGNGTQMDASTVT